jgi:hypothetical protein
MPGIDLSTLVELVGTLDDSPDANSAASRFRHYLRDNIRSVSDVRAYTEVALTTKGDQYNKALQDIINHIGRLLGFEVTFGRYRGVRGQSGYDGFWHSSSGRSVVVEAKTTDTYTVKTATLLGYINGLVSEGKLSKPEQALGLYIYGRFDSGATQLENAIIAEGRQEQLRVASVETLLHLLELTQEYEVEHQTIFQLLLPSPVRVDTVVNLIFDVVSRAKREVAGPSLGHKPLLQEHVTDQPRPKRRGRPRKGSEGTDYTEAVDIDTVVIPAREDGFNEVFLGEQRWYAVRIQNTIQPKIKYIAAYQVAPVSAITHIAPIKSIEPWKDTGKLVVNFTDAAQEIGPITLVEGGRVRAPQSLRYTTRQRLESAKNLDDVW